MRNFEIKAQKKHYEICTDLRQINAVFQTQLHQIDTYFDVPIGRLKLREIENQHAELISYQRDDLLTSRYCNYYICLIDEPKNLKQILDHSLGIRGVVEKRRDLWSYGETRIHLDRVENLGEFVELETVMRDQSENEAIAEHQFVRDSLQLNLDEIVAESYIDLLIYKSSLKI